MEIISLRNPYPNGAPSKEDIQPFCDVLEEIWDKFHAGERVYLEITSGERKGSIAYIAKLDDVYKQDKPGGFYLTRDLFRKNETLVRVTKESLNVILGWEGRRNQIKWSTCNNTNYLRGYAGPTVWEKFDKKAAEKKMLEEYVVLDREENKLEVGDRVLYINARYGSGATLDRGTITLIKFSVNKTTYRDSEYSTVHVFIRNDDGSDSDIKQPQLSILKLEGI